MFKQGDFSNAINCITLTFKDQDLELVFNNQRKQHLNFCSKVKILIIIVCIITSVFFSYSAHSFYEEDDYQSKIKVYLIICVINGAWIIEFIIHYFPCLNLLGGFAFIICLSIATVLESALMLPTFAILPDGMSYILLMLFAGVFYSRNWICATIALTIGYILITAISWGAFASKMDNIRLINLDIDMNISLFVLAFLYYYIETLQRIQCFQKWQTEQVIHY